MAWAWAYLGVTVVGALFVLNAFRPVRNGLFVVQSFFAGWYTAEMPLWHIVWQAAATVVFGFEGAFRSWPGWLGIGIALASWVGLYVHARIATGAHGVLSQAEAEVPVPAADGVDLPSTGRHTMWRFPRLIWPFPRPTMVVRTIRNIDYWGDGRRAHRLDVIVRRENPPERGAPVFVYVHGGAWIIGDKREQGFPLLFELARRGWVCVTINYRLSPRATWPDHIVDCKRAVAWTREHIGSYGGDPGFIGIAGGSAGGHLAALLALSAGDPAFQPGFEDADCHVDACVPIYGQYDMTCRGGKTVRDWGDLRLLQRQVFKTTLAEHPEVFEAASPLCRLREDAPPFFVIHGRNDTLIPVAEARDFVRELRRVSRSAVLYAELPYTQHAFDVLPSVRSAHAVAAVVRFLEGVRHQLVPAEAVSVSTLAAEEDAGPSA